MPTGANGVRGLLTLATLGCAACAELETATLAPTVGHAGGEVAPGVLARLHREELGGSQRGGLGLDVGLHLRATARTLEAAPLVGMVAVPDMKRAFPFGRLGVKLPALDVRRGVFFLGTGATSELGVALPITAPRSQVIWGTRLTTRRVFTLSLLGDVSVSVDGVQPFVGIGVGFGTAVEADEANDPTCPEVICPHFRNGP